MKNIFKSCALLVLMSLYSCSSKTESISSAVAERPIIEMTTSLGIIKIELYNETPLHRNNFIKLANEGAYDSLLFHRVINQFMIQGGDPKSRNARPEVALGSGGLSYKIDAEINPRLFHKRGALGAARDGNPARASSSMQFYIVQRGVQTDSLLDHAETRINGWLANYYSNNDPANKELLEAMLMAEQIEDTVTYASLNDSLRNLAENYTKFEKYKIPEAHREMYKALGGTPHLDQNYTVFGEVIQGMEIVDSIAVVQTSDSDRPVTDVRILSVQLLEKKKNE